MGACRHNDYRCAISSDFTEVEHHTGVYLLVSYLYALVNATQSLLVLLFFEQPNQGVTVTDSEGEFDTKNLSRLNATDTLHFSCVGYMTKSISLLELRKEHFLVCKSNIWWMWIVGAIYSGSTWLLIYYGTTLHRFTENSKPSFPLILKVLVLGTAGWALVMSFIPISPSSTYLRSAAIIIQVLIIRATIASYCYRTLLKGKVLFCILYLVFGAVALLAGQTIAIIAANHKKNGIQPPLSSYPVRYPFGTSLCKKTY